LGNGLTTLDGTFTSCWKLVAVDLPDHLTSMNLVFGGCSALTTVEIPATVTSLTGAFKGCTKLTSVALPAGVTATGNETFMGCTSLQSATLPDGMVSIGDYAFYNCSSLESVNLPSALTMIGDYAFYNCPGLTSVVFPPALISIGGAAFQGCTGLTSLVVPNSVTIIGDNAFWACVNVTEFVLPKHFLASIANIGLDYKPELATKALVSGLASELTSSPAFVSALADAILAKSGNYGISTKEDITNVVNQTPETVREVIAEMGTELPVAHGITSDLGTLTVKKGKEVQYAVSTTFTATSFAASGLPDGVTIHPTTGMITGKARKVGVYHAFLHAGVTGGGVVSAVKVFIVTP
ncbi:MAG TPA: leucine-rich repeat domain-containing protein, partial [Haloferula sp.]